LIPYFFLFVRLGPSGKYGEDWRYYARMAGQCILVVAFQCVGAVVAAVSSKGLPTYTDMHGANDMVSGKDMDPGLIVLEEILAVCAFFMGMVHVLQCEVPEMLENAERKDNTLPIKAIMYVSVLVAGLSRAFPSAHFGLHVSVFMLARGVGGALFRVLGGCVGTLIAIVCFRVWRAGDKPPGEPNPFFQKIARLR
jgi:hypothetical protein